AALVYKAAGNPTSKDQRAEYENARRQVARSIVRLHAGRAAGGDRDYRGADFDPASGAGQGAGGEPAGGVSEQPAAGPPGPQLLCPVEQRPRAGGLSRGEPAV